MPQRALFGTLSLKGRALRCLAQRDHSRVELQRKLLRWVEPGAEPPAAQQVAALLDDLERQGLLSEQRTAQALLVAKSPRYGAHRLRQMMQLRGLAPDLIGATLQQAQHSEVERALEIWRRKFGVAASSAAERARQMRFLLGRGFSGEVVRQVIKGAGEEDEV